MFYFDFRLWCCRFMRKVCNTSLAEIQHLIVCAEVTSNLSTLMLTNAVVSCTIMQMWTLLPLSVALHCQSLSVVCPCTQNYREKTLELTATAITTLTHNVLGLEKLSHSSLNKQAAQSLLYLPLCALFSGTKLWSNTLGPTGWPWFSISPLCSNFNVLVGTREGTQERAWEDNRTRIDENIFRCVSSFQWQLTSTRNKSRG